MTGAADTRHGGEAGLTLIEVVVASLVLALAALATFGVLAAATKNAQRAKASQVAQDLAQEEIERLRAVPFDQLALSSVPETSESALNPGSRVGEEGKTFALQRNPVGEYAPLVINEEFGFSPKSEFLSGEADSGGVGGTVYRYVVWRDDESCPETECPGEQDYKQVIVAVQPKAGSGQQSERGYVEVQAKRIDPEEASEPAPSEGGEEGGGGPGNEGDPVTAQQFFFSDTACSESGETTRAEIESDHLLHNTLGTCASGPQTGSSVGAPDTLLLAAPPDPDPLDEFNPALFDYSNDFYLEPTPDTDKGVQIRRDDTSGCHYDPTGTANPESQVHRWVSDPVPHAFQMSGAVTLEFYTRTLNDALYTGSLCIFLFDRVESGGGETAEDTFLVDQVGANPYWVYEPEGNGFWPRNSWTKVRLTMEFEEAPHVIPAGQRLGVALGVDPANTPADAIPVMYDHPNYPSRLEVDTTTPIEGG